MRSVNLKKAEKSQGAVLWESIAQGLGSLGVRPMEMLLRSVVKTLNGPEQLWVGMSQEEE